MHRNLYSLQFLKLISKFKQNQIKIVSHLFYWQIDSIAILTRPTLMSDEILLQKPRLKLYLAFKLPVRQHCSR